MTAGFLKVLHDDPKDAVERVAGDAVERVAGDVAEHEQELKRIRRQAELEAAKRQAEAKAETEKYEIYHQLSAKHNELVQTPGLLASSV